MNRTIIVTLAGLLVISGGLVVWSAVKLYEQRRAPEVSTQAVKLPAPGSDQEIIKTFELTERSGQTLGNEDLRGSVWIGSFFFAACPGSCRTQNMHLMGLQRKYADRGVKIVSITCDPQTDTPAKLREYADSFQAQPDAWYFLTGDLGYIRRIGAEFFQVHVDLRGHMDRFVVVDKWGNIRGYYDWHDPQKLAELGDMVETLLAETEPPADLVQDEQAADANVNTLAEESGEVLAEDEAESDEPQSDEALSDQAQDTASEDTEATGELEAVEQPDDSEIQPETASP